VVKRDPDTYQKTFVSDVALTTTRQRPLAGGTPKETRVPKVALKTKMTFGHYQLPVVVDTGRYHSSSAAPVMGVWCPEINDRSALLTCSSCRQFGGLVQDPELIRMFVRCRCGSAETEDEERTSDSSVTVRPRRLRADDPPRR